MLCPIIMKNNCKIEQDSYSPSFRSRSPVLIHRANKKGGVRKHLYILAHTFLVFVSHTCLHTSTYTFAQCTHNVFILSCEYCKLAYHIHTHAHINKLTHTLRVTSCAFVFHQIVCQLLTVKFPQRRLAESNMTT